jgi:multicomponent Na+:H+ antiporter subunit A
MNDHLRYYVITILVFLTSLLVFFEFYIGNGFRNIPINYASLSEVTYYEVGIISLLMVAIWITISTRSRLNAVAALGVSGFTICLLFVFYSAPDLAMTQFSIDTLTVILFVLILYKLPPFRIYSNLRTRIRDGVLSLAVGSLITIIILQVLQVDVDKSITRYYLENAYILAKGKNVVNVILVDFRGMDTMIEIIVLAMSAIGVYALLKFKLNDSEESI